MVAALRDAAEAARDGDQAALASARGSVRAGLYRGAFIVTVEATERGDAATAKEWLLLREYRTATRFTRPGAQATLALDQLQRGKLAPTAAGQAVRKDLLDAYQARLRDLLADARRGVERISRPPLRGRRAGRGLLRDPRPALHRGSRRRGGEGGQCGLRGAA